MEKVVFLSIATNWAFNLSKPRKLPYNKSIQKEGIPATDFVCHRGQCAPQCRPETARVGIMGGTFNPIHVGHTEMAQKAYEALGLREVLFIPVGTPPHKPGVFVASPEDRLEMVRRAVEDRPHFAVNTMELQRKGYTYAVDTLHQLIADYPPRTEFYYILGGDAFLYLENWYHFEEAIGLCSYVVFERAGVEPRLVRELAEKLRNRYGARILLMDYEPTPVSSTLLRQCIQGETGTMGLLHPKVERYIREKGVYCHGSK
jgi:nicotinate-nucleotide adenylyltransferase